MIHEAMVRNLMRRYVEAFVEVAPTRGPASNDAADIPWRAITSMAGDATPECYKASSRADLLIARARCKCPDNWKSVLLAEIRKEETDAQEDGSGPQT